jgi:hypothetical protein
VKQVWKDKLLLLPQEIYDEETKQFNLESELKETKELILDIEADFKSTIAGKNEHIRNALLRKHMKHEAQDLLDQLVNQEQNLRLQRIYVQKLRNEFTAIQVVFNNS